MNLILIEALEREFFSSDDRYQHIKKILKKSTGDFFAAGIVNGGKGKAWIEELTDRVCRFRFEEEQKSRPLLDLTLLVGMVRPITARRMLKDLTTLGVGRIWFVQTDLTDKSYRAGSLWKEESYQKYLREGAAQAGETYLPEIEIPYSLKSALERLPQDGFKIAFDNGPLASPLLRQKDFQLPVVVAIGSERGWTDSERQLLQEKGFEFCTLGKRILRTETAASAALGMILHQSGEW